VGAILPWKVKNKAKATKRCFRCQFPLMGRECSSVINIAPDIEYKKLRKNQFIYIHEKQ
jgi:hypothetical protein